MIGFIISSEVKPSISAIVKLATERGIMAVASDAFRADYGSLHRLSFVIVWARMLVNSVIRLASSEKQAQNLLAEAD